LHIAHSLLSYQIRQLEKEPEGGKRLIALRGAGSQALLLARRAECPRNLPLTSRSKGETYE
jgi:hypothetical protein